MSLGILAGRTFTPADVSAKPRSVIVNEAFSVKFFPDHNPIRLTLVIERFGAFENVEMEIVGVAGDEKSRSPKRNKTVEPVIYAAMAQQRQTGSSVYG